MLYIHKITVRSKHEGKKRKVDTSQTKDYGMQRLNRNET